MERFFRQTILMTVVATLPSFGIAMTGSFDGTSFYTQGLHLYQQGRLNEATDAFEKAIKKSDHPKESQTYIDRIRLQTVDEIRTRAMTGVSKASWVNQFYFISKADGHAHVGISLQAVFEHNSLNLRPGAADAMTQLSDMLARSDGGSTSIDLVSEVPLSDLQNKELLAQQQMLVYSFLSTSINGNVLK